LYTSSIPSTACDADDCELRLDGDFERAATCSHAPSVDNLDRLGFFAGPVDDTKLRVGDDNDTSQGAWEIDPHDLMLEGIITSGQAADIYRGELDGQVVAVKVYRRAKLFNVKQQVAFCREVETLGRLSHPNLVKLIGACMLSSPFRLATEYCDGGNLNELLHERSEVEVSWHQRMKIGADIAKAMVYLHSRDPQIIHRDLTSTNCLLAYEVRGPEEDVVVKVGNFGFARMRDREAGRTSMTSDVGTLLWMAPEILNREDYDSKVDVYSFGIILYELVFRQMPFGELDECSFSTTVASGGRPDIDCAPDGCPIVIVGLMQACWEHEPTDRPPFSDIAASLAR